MCPAVMAGIVKKDFHSPDDTYQFVHGRSLVVRVADGEEVWRSELEPGWNWDEDLKPYAEGATSSPMTHREYVVEGRIRYLSNDRSEVVGSPRIFSSCCRVIARGSLATRPACSSIGRTDPGSRWPRRPCSVLQVNVASGMSAVPLAGGVWAVTPRA